MRKDKIKPVALWVTREELAVRYAVNVRTIDEWRRQGELPFYKLGTRLLRFDLQACDGWISKVRHSAKWEG